MDTGEKNAIVFTGRAHGPWTRPVNTASVNRPLPASTTRRVRLGRRFTEFYRQQTDEDLLQLVLLGIGSPQTVDAIHVRREVARIPRRVHTTRSQRRRAHEVIATRRRRRWLIVRLLRLVGWAFPVTWQRRDVTRRHRSAARRCRRHFELPCMSRTNQGAIDQSINQPATFSGIARDVNWRLDPFLLSSLFYPPSPSLFSRLYSSPFLPFY